MAIRECSECGKDVSSKAAACPNCGAPVDKRKDRGQREGCFLQTLNAGCVLILFVLLAIAGIIAAVVYIGS